MFAYDITAIGESLIDFTPLPAADGKLPQFVQNPGGAPANLVVAAQRIGARTAFLGKMGDDPFGRFLLKTVQAHGVCTQGVFLSEAYQTSLAFVSLDEAGQRSFSFYRDPGADQMLREDEICYDVLEKTRAVHISSLAYCGEVISRTTDTVGAWAKAEGKIITYDANWRPMLWKDQRLGRAQLKKGLAYADIVKASEEELAILTDGLQDERQSAQKLLENGARIVAVTKGENGCSIYTRGFCFRLPAFPVRAVDTTSAGDAFFGTFVYQLLQFPKLDDISLPQMRECARFSSAYAAISTTRLGGIPSLPTKDETLQWLRDFRDGAQNAAFFE